VRVPVPVLWMGGVSHMTTKFALGSAVLAAALALGGCGGGGQPVTQAPAVTAAPAVTEAPAATQAPVAAETPAPTEAAGGSGTLTAAPGTVVVALGGAQETYQVSDCSATAPTADMAGLFAMVGKSDTLNYGAVTGGLVDGQAALTNVTLVGIFGGNPWAVQTNASANVAKSSGVFSGTFSGKDEFSGEMVQGAFACR
jgi:hypothetical protein